MDRAQSVSESELKIMHVLWAHGGTIMLSELMKEFTTQGNPWKPNTVLTFLSRLSEKGMIRVDKAGRLNRYTALISEQEYMAALTKNFVSDVYGGNTKGLIASLLRMDRLSKKDMDELRAFWEGVKDGD